MPANTAPQRPTIAEGEVRNVSVSFVDVLDDGELLTGTPTVSEQGTSNLTISNVSINSANLTINGESVSPGQAVQFRVSGQRASTGSYTIKITVGTDATPPQTLVKYIRFSVDTE